MPNYTVQDFNRIRPEIEESSISEHITNKISDNYCKGLNGKYSNRLGKGIQVATQATADQLTDIIKQLIDDRAAKGAETRVNSSQVDRLLDGQKRALILALWSSRIPFINREGKIDIELRAVYENENYMPRVGLSTSISDLTAISKPKRLYDLNEEKVKKVIEAIAGLRDDDNIPVKDVIDFIKSDADKMGISLSSDFENEVRQIIKKIMKNN